MWKNWAEFLFGAVVCVVLAVDLDNSWNNNDWLWVVLASIALLWWMPFTARAWRRI